MDQATRDTLYASSSLAKKTRKQLVRLEAAARMRHVAVDIELGGKHATTRLWWARVNKCRLAILNIDEPARIASRRAPIESSALALAYDRAVEWVAENDESGCLDRREVAQQITVVLVADVFGREVEAVAHDVVRFRANVTISRPLRSVADVRRSRSR